MNWPKISIIIPVYNVEPYISECLQSVMRQTYQGSMESLVVDDCSTDKSIEIAEKLIAEYDGPIEFRMLHHKHNRGLSAARNTGVENANGDYVLFLDSDDHITDDCLDVLTGPLKEKDYDMVLAMYYGNWRKLVRSDNTHGDIVFDMTKPYTEFLSEAKPSYDEKIASYPVLAHYKSFTNAVYRKDKKIRHLRRKIKILGISLGAVALALISLIITISL